METENISATRIVDEENIITGEGVRLQIQPLNLLTRLLALAIDLFALGVFFILTLITTLYLGRYYLPSINSVNSVVLVVFVLYASVIPTLIETLSGGYSLGKYIVGARVLREDGGRVRFRHCFTRNIIGFLEIYLFATFPAVITIFFSAKYKRIGDHFAGTYVAKLPDTTSPLPLVMPPQLKQWSQKVVLSPIPQDLYLTARNFIYRAGELDVNIRRKTAQNLVSQLVVYIDKKPENYSDDERLIVAILVTHRDKNFKNMLSKISS